MCHAQVKHRIFIRTTLSRCSTEPSHQSSRILQRSLARLILPLLSLLINLQKAKEGRAQVGAIALRTGGKGIVFSCRYDARTERVLYMYVFTERDTPEAWSNFIGKVTPLNSQRDSSCNFCWTLRQVVIQTQKCQAQFTPLATGDTQLKRNPGNVYKRSHYASWLHGVIFESLKSLFCFEGSFLKARLTIKLIDLSQAFYCRCVYHYQPLV